MICTEVTCADMPHHMIQSHGISCEMLQYIYIKLQRYNVSIHVNIILFVL